jgi:hypothetical protein
MGAAAGAVTDARAASTDAAAATAAPGKPLMKVGTQHDSSDETLGILAALGVNNICSTLPSATFDDRWSVEGLTRKDSRACASGSRSSGSRWTWFRCP